MRIRGQADIEVFITAAEAELTAMERGENGENMIEFAPAYGAKVAEAIRELQDFAQTKFEKAVLVDD